MVAQELHACDLIHSPWGPASQSWFSRESAEASLHMEFNQRKHKPFDKKKPL